MWNAVTATGAGMKDAAASFCPQPLCAAAESSIIRSSME
jgi:hypothetical protein